MALIDSGFILNFIINRVARHLKLPVISTPSFLVKVVNGEPKKCSSQFEIVTMSNRGIPFTITFYSLALTGLHVVLGVQWLESLGTMAYDWKNLTMEF